MSDIKERLAKLTPEQRAKLLSRMAQTAVAQVGDIIPLKQVSPIPLSFAQYRLWFLDQLEGASANYNIPFALKLKGQLNKSVLSHCFNEIIQRHTILRTHFLNTADGPRQVIRDHTEVTIECYSIEPALLEQTLFTEAHVHFNLSTGPLYQLKLFELSPSDHIFMITMHHSITDGWSMGVLTHELVTLYEAFLVAKPSPLKALPIQYTDYTQWQQSYLTQDKLDKLLSYWQTHLAGMQPIVALPTDYPRPAQQSHRGAIYMFHLDKEFVKQLQTLSQEEDVTLYMLLLAVFYVVLAKYANQYDITLGTTIANRNRKEVESLIGLFVNTLVLRAVFDKHTPFKVFLQEIKKITLNAYEHQDLPFDKLVKALLPERNLAYSPLFQVMFELNNTPYEELTLPGLEVSIVEQNMQVAKFDLTLTLQTDKNGLQAAVEYSTDLFKESTIAQFSNHYQNALQCILKNTLLRIEEIQILSHTERKVLLAQFNQTTMDLPLHKSVAILFEQQVSKTPDKIAATCRGETITYFMLNEQANRVALHLQKSGVTLEHVVALYLDRGIPFLVAMLGVLKAGAAFVPLDPKNPDIRIREILDQCRPTVVLTSKLYQDAICQWVMDSAILTIEIPIQDPQVIHFNSVSTYPNSLAYIIFTSGSTGKPKGAMVEQSGMVNHLYGKIVDLQISDKDVIGQIAVQTFDVCIWQFLAALLVGGRTAILIGDDAWEPKLLLSKIDEESITILESVPSHTKVILDEQEAFSTRYHLNSLRMYITNGEPLTPEQCKRWFTQNPNIMMVNAYGATECSDDSHHLHLVETPQIDMAYVPVKQPLPNQQTYLLDDRLEPTPFGVIGEIYFSGKGVGRGYVADASKTAVNFIPNPFSTGPGERLYKTGDLARRHVDGFIEFLGRSDFQVKIRGFRIEVGEVEAALVSHVDIESTVVLAQKDLHNQYHLMAYVVPKTYPAPTIETLKAYCKSMLPEYMVPETIVLLDAFPLSHNGKVDRKKLPSPQIISQAEYVAPRNSLEEQIAAVWGQVLRKEKISIHDNFFQIGGHSLIAAELAIKLQTTLGFEINLRKIFEFPTIETFAATLSLKMTDEAEVYSVKKTLPKDAYPLAPCQIPEWYAYQVDKNSPIYNISFSDLFFKNLDIPIFMQAWQVILNRHDIFRIHFDYQNGQPIQKLSPPMMLNATDFCVDYTHIEAHAIDSVAEKLAYQYSHTVFDFESGPLFILKVAAYPDNQYQLLFVIHHIIWDETSTINLFTELAEIYNAILNNRAMILPDLRLSYFDYVEWMNESIEAGRFDKHRAYWLNLYKDVPPVLNLPCDYPRPALQTYKGESVSAWITRAQLHKLRPYLQDNNVTLFMFMLTVINLYFFRITGQKDIVIGSPIADRDLDDFKPILGLFATPMPLRCQLEDSMSFKDLLEHVKHQCLDAYEHHYYPCNRVIEELNHAKDLSRPKLFSVMYGVQNNKTDLYANTHFDKTERFFKNLYGAEANSARFDLTLVVDQWGSDIAFNCIYNIDLFKASTIERMMENLLHLIDEVLVDDALALRQYPIMSSQSLQHITTLFNQNALAYPAVTLHQLFTRQAEKTPHAIAIQCVDASITYQALNKAANAVAYYLLEVCGVKRGQAVAVMVNPSVEMIIVLLGILKIGAHYVPILPTYPQARTEYILTHAEAKIIIVETNSSFAFNGLKISLDEIHKYIQTLPSIQNIDHAHTDDLAYVIYTSGTTGNPKGIPIKHNGLINLIYSTQVQHQLTSNDSVLFITPFTFDASILDIFWPLATGAKIFIPPLDSHKNSNTLADLLKQFPITVLQCVPILLEALIDTQIKPRQLRLVISGGALLTKSLRDRFYNQFTCQLYNHYGPTEVSVDASSFDCSQPFIGEVVPIGKPIANTKIFILDPYLNIVPLGVPGEIYIASPGLTPDYLKEAQKSKQVFIDKIINNIHYRLYKTGDLGKLADDGNVYYIGRVDKQVKIRGNRVELEEIDNALMHNTFIKKCLTKYIPTTATDGRLVSFIEYCDSFNSFFVDGHRYQMFTLAERPELLKKVHAAHADAWPSYFAGSRVLKEYWSKLYTDFPEFQIALVTENDELAAVGNTIPIFWNGNPNDLPKGWDDAITSGFKTIPQQSNTLLILAGIVTREFQGKNLSIEILKGFKAIKQGFHFERMLVAVRPTGKIAHPNVSFTQWCEARRTDGQLQDNWLRMHERIGGKILKIILDSQYVEASVKEWESWTQSTITASGKIDLPGTLQPVEVDLEQQIVKYFDPAVWVEHFTEDDYYLWQCIDQNVLRQFLATLLPGYMIPTQFYFLPKLPLLDTGKIDERLVSLPTEARLTTYISPKSDLQHKLVSIWQSILKHDSISITDDFFELGGQSLKVIQMLSLVEKECGYKVPLCQFYLASTIKGLEENIFKLKSE